MDGGWQSKRSKRIAILLSREKQEETKKVKKKSHVSFGAVQGVATYVLLLYITALGLINNTP